MTNTPQTPSHTAPTHTGAIYEAGDQVNIISMYAGGEREVFTIASVLSPYEVRIAGLRRTRGTRELVHAS